MKPPGLISAGCGFSPGAAQFAGAYRLKGQEKNGAVGLWDISDDKLVFRSSFVDPKDLNISSVFSPNGKLLATIPVGNGSDPSMHVWDLEPNPPRLVADIPNVASFAGVFFFLRQSLARQARKTGRE